MNMKELKLETLRPIPPKIASLSHVGKAERNIQKLRKTAIKNLKNRSTNPGSGEASLKEWSRVEYNTSRCQTTGVGGPLWKGCNVKNYI